MKRRFAIFATAALVWWLGDPGAAYQLSGVRWPSGSSIVVHLQQGSSGGALMDGSADWDAVTDGALGSWNSVLGSVSFHGLRDSSSGVSLRNGSNNVAFADNMYGDAFGDAIAVTFWLSRNGAATEADVLFDRARNWNSYRGNLQRGSNGTVYDLRRVALHEFGHVLGLDHPDDHGQSVTAIMNSHVSNVDSLQADDMNGVRAIYGGSTAPPPPPSVNHPPTVTASCDPCTVEAELTTSLRAIASDPDGDALSYQWSAPQGSFSNANAASTVWTAPAPESSVTATVTVQDGRGGKATATVALQVVARDKLRPNARLLGGQSLLSANLHYRLAYQGDGNLVLYDEVDKKALWASNTSGSGVEATVMQGDGNLVVYDAQDKARWSSGTMGHPNAYLLVQNDGNLVLYLPTGQALWDRFRPGTLTTRGAPARADPNEY